MKILTLNTHSLIESNYQRKLSDFVCAVNEERPDIIALQEVNQTSSQQLVEGKIRGYIPCCDDIIIRKDNHVFKVSQMLCEKGAEYYWTWLPIKNGYGNFDEGIALMSRSLIIKTDIATVSQVDDYNNWKTRKIIGICTKDYPDEWFFSVHYGWWNDKEEPFSAQWNKTEIYMKKYDLVWLMGDFNNPSEVRNEGYDMIKNSQWHDSFILAENKDSGISVEKIIDGWKDKIDSTDGMRIDQIWCSKKQTVKSSKVIFNGMNYPIVSDHYGVIINYERESH